MSPGDGPQSLIDGLQGFFGALLGSKTTPLVILILGGPLGMSYITLSLLQPIGVSLRHFIPPAKPLNYFLLPTNRPFLANTIHWDDLFSQFLNVAGDDRNIHVWLL